MLIMIVGTACPGCGIPLQAETECGADEDLNESAAQLFVTLQERIAMHKCPSLL